MTDLLQINESQLVDSGGWGERKLELLRGMQRLYSEFVSQPGNVQSEQQLSELVPSPLLPVQSLGKHSLREVLVPGFGFRVASATRQKECDDLVALIRLVMSEQDDGMQSAIKRTLDETKADIPDMPLYFVPSLLKERFLSDGVSSTLDLTQPSAATKKGRNRSTAAFESQSPDG